MKWKCVLIRYSFFLIFVGYYLSITFFTHSHVVLGITIVHSHPYKSGTTNHPIKHQHTTDEFILIQLLSEFLTTLVFFAILFNLFPFIIKSFLIKEKFVLIYTILSSLRLRAPPSISFYYL